MSAQSALPEEADRNQARASDPSASAWVSANAGTGKTGVWSSGRCGFCSRASGRNQFSA